MVMFISQSGSANMMVIMLFALYHGNAFRGGLFAGKPAERKTDMFSGYPPCRVSDLTAGREKRTQMEPDH